MSLIWVWLAGSAFAADLVVDGTVVATHGTHTYDRVLVVNGGRLVVNPAGVAGSAGTLTLNARSILVDATSAIDGTGAGMQGVAGAAVAGGGAAGVAGGGGSHGGLGAPGTDGTCAVDIAVAGPARGAAPDLVTEVGAAGGGGSDLVGGAKSAGGAGGAAITLDAEHVEIHGEILVDGAPGAAGAWGGGGGGGGGGVVIQALTLDCDGEISARGGDGGPGASFGGAGGGGIVEQWWDRDGEACAVDVTGGDGTCGSGSAGIETAIGDLDWDGDLVSTADGDCAPDDAAVKLGAAETCDGRDNDCDGTVDDGACVGCVAFTAGGRSYLDCTTAVNRSTALTNCSGKVAGEPGYRLLVVDDAAENAAIAGYLVGANNTNHWLAIDDLAAEDTFEWEGPANSWYTNWGAGEPNNSGGEDCAYMIPGTGLWNDSTCGGTADYVCELCELETWYADDDGDGWGDASVTAGDCFGPPAGYVARAGDCDDGDASVSPSAPEACDGVDNDCDGTLDPVAISWFPDADDDGWGDGTGIPQVRECGLPEPALTASRVGDCDDGAATRSPGDPEVCNGVDDDCNGEVDEIGCGCDIEIFAGSTYHFCDSNVSRATAQGECDNLANTNLAEVDDATENIFLTEAADRIDDGQFWWIGLNDLVTEGVYRWVDGSAPVFTSWEAGQPNNSGNQDCAVFNDVTAGDEDSDWNDRVCTDLGNFVCEVDCEPYDWYPDADGDGWGDLLGLVSACARPAGYVSNDADCDDSDPATHPSAGDPAADGVDGDCSGDDTCFLDDDGDGWGSATVVLDTTGGCTGPFEADNDEDCDDADPAVNPGAVEAVGDGDLDCDGAIACWFDEDQDGAGTPIRTYSADGDCGDAYESADADDCDDSDAGVAPGTGEIVGDGVDQDCDAADLCWVDADGDEYGSALVVSDPDLDCATGASRTAVPGDCDDAKVAVHPGAVELAGDGADQDCTGTELCFADKDGDGSAGSTTAPSIDADCSDAGEFAAATDCDDAKASVEPGAPEVVGDGVDQDCDAVDSCYVDGDLDTWGSSVVVDDTDLLCGNGGSRAGRAGDCADGDPAVHPTAAEIPVDGADQDCDGAELCYLDDDGDGFGGAATVASADLDCTGPGVSLLDTDCDDDSAAIHPNAAEIQDGIDNNCDGEIDICFADLDLDGFGDAASTLPCSDPAAVADPSDCDDGDPDINVAAEEIPGDPVDEDCSGVIACFADADGDGHGDATDPGQDAVGQATCDDAPAGWADDADDCADDDAAISPSATEIPQDAVDGDCDGDDGCWRDADGDAFGDDATVIPCSDPASSTAPGDCDDADDTVSPAGVEAAGDDRDEDCDGALDCWTDADGDGFGGTSGAVVTVPGPTCDQPALGAADDELDCDDAAAGIHPDAPEVPGDGIDNDCDDLVDEDDVETGDTAPATDDLPSVDDRPLPADDAAALGEGCDCDAGAPGAGWLALVGLMGLIRRRRNG